MAGMHLIMIWGTYKYFQGTREQRYVLRDEKLPLCPNDPTRNPAIEYRDPSMSLHGIGNGELTQSFLRSRQ